MGKDTKEMQSLLKDPRYTRGIVHLKKQYDMKRLGMVFGAGLSRKFGIAGWPNLIDKIAKNPEIDAEKIISKTSGQNTLPYKTQMLIEHYRKKRSSEVEPEEANSPQFRGLVSRDFNKIIRKHLYRYAKRDISDAIEKHPYVSAFLEIVKKTHLTVTYNFDDMLERCLHERTPKDKERPDRGYATVTNAALQFRRAEANIYHPNGFIPTNPTELPSDNIIFSEESFADMLLDMFSGDYSIMPYHLSKNTCLLIGLSGDDPSLRSLLRQCARCNPGHFHYFVKYIRRPNSISDKSRAAIYKTNFEVYNLKTMFLTDKQIAALGWLLTLEPEEFVSFAKKCRVRVKFPFYITGPLGVGKSTVITYLRSLTSHDEWMDPRLPELNRYFKRLKGKKKELVDSWVAEQFKLKNKRVVKEPYGLIVLDRAPLDPLGFTEKAEWRAKATRLLRKIRKDGNDVQPGTVVLLTGDANELADRLKLSEREEYTSEKVTEMQQFLLKAYRGPGVHEIKTQDLTLETVVRRVAEIIHEWEYRSMNLGGRLEKIEEDGFEV